MAYWWEGMHDDEAEQRSELLEILRVSSSATRRRVGNLLRSVGEDPDSEDGTDLMRLSRDVIAVVQWAALGSLLLPDERGQRMRWYEYKKGLSVAFYNAVEWIRHRRPGSLSSQLSRKIIECRANGWPVYRVVYVRPSRHYGRSVGGGVFAMIQLKRGHLLFQFTGSVVPGGKSFLSQKASRQDYCIEFRHGTEEYTVNPLTTDDSAPHPDNVAAYINEPSPPPWAPGELASVHGRNVVVRRYDYKQGTYGVEYAKGEVGEVAATDLTAHPAHPAVERVFEANVFWYDFPVPLKDLYRPHGAAVGRARSVVYTRTAEVTTTVPWPLALFLKTFDGFSDNDGVYRMERRIALSTLARGHLVFMRGTVFMGLERFGVVVAVDRGGDGLTRSVTVRHPVAANTLWRLPRTVLAGKVSRCVSCRQSEDPTCTRCTVVPFPLVYACKDIRPGQELLCLYSTRIKSRGLPCHLPLQDDDLLPRWDGH